MSPEEHFRRLKNGDVWRSTEHLAAPAAPPARAQVRDRDRGPMWVTSVVGALLVVVTLAAVHSAGRSTNGTVAGVPAAAPVTDSAVPARTATPSPTPSDSRSVGSSDPSLRVDEFYPDDPADMARAKTIIACFKSHGVRLVSLSPSYDDPKIDNIGYGGPHNDHESIMKGLKYQDECFKAGGPAK